MSGKYSQCFVLHYLFCALQWLTFPSPPFPARFCVVLGLLLTATGYARDNANVRANRQSENDERQCKWRRDKQKLPFSLSDWAVTFRGCSVALPLRKPPFITSLVFLFTSLCYCLCLLGNGRTMLIVALHSISSLGETHFILTSCCALMANYLRPTSGENPEPGFANWNRILLNGGRASGQRQQQRLPRATGIEILFIIPR